jgi:hypothetical protein
VLLPHVVPPWGSSYAHRTKSRCCSAFALERSHFNALFSHSGLRQLHRCALIPVQATLCLLPIRELFLRKLYETLPELSGTLEVDNVLKFFRDGERSHLCLQNWPMMCKGFSMLRRCCVFMNPGPTYNLSYILSCFFRQFFFHIHRATGRHATVFVYWWIRTFEVQRQALCMTSTQKLTTP